MMVSTYGEYSARHWLTLEDGWVAVSACGRRLQRSEAVLMPGALVDCRRCAAQYEAYALAVMVSMPN
jgi:hypothetical protein